MAHRKVVILPNEYMVSRSRRPHEDGRSKVLRNYHITTRRHNPEGRDVFF
jgi:hypothetical protein